MFLIVSFLLNACDLVSNKAEPKTREEWKELLKWSDTCGSGELLKFFSASKLTGVSIHKLTDSSFIVEVICQIASYNQGEIIYYVSGLGASQKINLLHFQQIRYIELESEPDYIAPDFFDPNAKTPLDTTDLYFTFVHHFLWGNLSVDKDTHTIVNNDYFSGAGGCGLQTQYKLVNGLPELISFRAQPHCTVATEPPEKWKFYSKEEVSKWPERSAPKGWGDPDSDY